MTVSKSVGYTKGEQFVKVPKTKHGFRKVAIPHFLTLRIKAMKTERGGLLAGRRVAICSGERQADELQHTLSGIP